MEAVLRSRFVIIWLRLSLKERPGLVAVSKVLGASLPIVTPKPAETGGRKCQAVNTWGWAAGGHGTQVHATLRTAESTELVCIQGMRARKPLQPRATGWEEPRAISGMGGVEDAIPRWSKVPLGLDSRKSLSPSPGRPRGRALEAAHFSTQKAACV